MPKSTKAPTGTGARYLFKKDVAPTKEGKWYPADDVSKPVKRKFTPGTAKLRKTITPGTIVILLAGRFKGKRAVFLSQLPSGLLLVTGPFAVNGVPLRRVNQAYVIATSTKVDVSGVKLPAEVNDAFFKAAEEKKSKGEQDFFALQEKKTDRAETSDARKALQMKIDASIKTSEEVKSYLKSRFALRKGDKPHEMVF